MFTVLIESIVNGPRANLDLVLFADGIVLYLFSGKNWKQRWFTLNRYELKYFKDKMVGSCTLLNKI